MTSTTTDLRDGVSTSVAIKAPVRSVCTTNITASGLSAISTIDGSLTPAAGDRFLLTAQTSSVNNGIYVAGSGTWERAKDFDTNRDVRKGTLIRTQNGIQYRVSASDPITIGTTALTFAADDNSNLATALASTAVDQGADLVGINDAGEQFTGTTVEDAMQETVTKAVTQTISGDKTFTGAVTLTGASSVLMKSSTISAGHTMLNGTLTASVAASALTIAIKTLAGADPSAADPVYILFRNATAATGDYTVLSVTAATSFVVSSGSTLGTSSSVAFRIWVVGFNDGGTFRLGVIYCGRSLNAGVIIYPLEGFAVASSTAEGGAGGADTISTFYTSSAVTNKAYATLGYMTWESGLATAGTWSAAPTRVQLFHQGVPLPGAKVQIQHSISGSVATGTTTIPNDDTIPQNTEGDQYLNENLAPSSAANILVVEVLFNGAISAGSPMAVALFQDSTANALAAAQTSVTVDVATQVVLRHAMTAGTTSSTTFAVRAGPSTAGTLTFNGAAAGQKLGGVMLSSIVITEIMA